MRTNVRIRMGARHYAASTGPGALEAALAAVRAGQAELAALD